VAERAKVVASQSACLSWRAWECNGRVPQPKQMKGVPQPDSSLSPQSSQPQIVNHFPPSPVCRLTGPISPQSSFFNPQRLALLYGTLLVARVVYFYFRLWMKHMLPPIAMATLHSPLLPTLHLISMVWHPSESSFHIQRIPVTINRFTLQTTRKTG